VNVELEGMQKQLVMAYLACLLRHFPGIPSEDVVVKHKVLIADISFEVFMVVIVLACDRIGPEDGSSILLSNSIHLQDYMFIIIVVVVIIIGKTAHFEL
jgi:hypothetical protein